ncbi:MAG: XdhC family protein [Deltaproteobacteria bacterium]|nr:XdhC family protein [Deltaproteobacteria bacterium]
MEREVIDSLAQCLRADIAAALVTVIENSGSSAGKSGSMMVVWGESESCGTVGGGSLERRAVVEARKCLAAGLSREVMFDAGDGDEQLNSCGGSSRLFIRVFSSGPKLIIVGSGHLGLELYNLGLQQGFRITVIDDREATPGRFPEAEVITGDEIGKLLMEYPVTGECCITIASRSHETDEQALEAVIGSGAGYIGMVGSSSKIKEIYHHLMSRGVTRQKLDAVYAPMGLNVATREPKEIATVKNISY